MFQLDLAARVPIYDQIINNVIKLTENGVLKPHDKLPAVRTLAVQLGINPNTVAKAYKQLEALGYTYSVAGKGSFVNERPTGLTDAQCEAVKQFKTATRLACREHVPKQRLLEEIEKLYKGGESIDRD